MDQCGEWRNEVTHSPADPALEALAIAATRKLVSLLVPFDSRLTEAGCLMSSYSAQNSLPIILAQ